MSEVSDQLEGVAGEVETVLLGSDSLDSLKHTHGRCFDSVRDIARQALESLDRKGA